MNPSANGQRDTIEKKRYELLVAMNVLVRNRKWMLTVLSTLWAFYYNYPSQKSCKVIYSDYVT